MSRFHIPGHTRWLCAICQAPTDQQHHIDYRSPETWAKVPLCNRHHTHLHRVHDRVRDQGVTIAVVSAQYLLDPDAARVLAITGDPRVHPHQLSLGDLATPQGYHWRRWEEKAVAAMTGEVVDRRREHGEAA